MKRTNVTDMQIVQCFLDREERAITLTHEKYGSYLYTVAYNILYVGFLLIKIFSGTLSF